MIVFRVFYLLIVGTILLIFSASSLLKSARLVDLENHTNENFLPFTEGQDVVKYLLMSIIGYLLILRTISPPPCTALFAIAPPSLFIILQSVWWWWCGVLLMMITTMLPPGRCWRRLRRWRPRAWPGVVATNCGRAATSLWQFWLWALILGKVGWYLIVLWQYNVILECEKELGSHFAHWNWQ